MRKSYLGRRRSGAVPEDDVAPKARALAAPAKVPARDLAMRAEEARGVTSLTLELVLQILYERVRNALVAGGITCCVIWSATQVAASTAVSEGELMQRPEPGMAVLKVSSRN